MDSSTSGSVWYLDSGASFHMTRDKESFIDLEEKYLIMHIEMGDDGRYSATGIGTITFQRESGKPFKLKNVMHAPGLKKNLVSVAMLEDRGYDVVFSSGKSYLRHKAMGQVKKIGIRVKNLYMLEVDGCGAMIGKVEKVVSRDEGELWHRRLGHLYHGALKIMQQISTGLTRGTLAQLDQCKGCTLGKYVKSNFHEKENRASVILERIHTDVCGPFSVASTAKHRYYVIFVDDFSCKCLIFFMQKKDQTFSKFYEFKPLVEKESGKQVKALRSDNGGEYICNEFKDFCNREGIRRELIAPQNPQQNGVAERKNRTIVGAARAMLHDQGLPMHLWAEACNTAVYVQNRCPYRALGMSTPEKSFTGKKPDISHFKIFASFVYVHVTKDSRKKLEPIAEVGIFLGYTETPHNYRLYLSNNNMTVIQWDIKFDEGKAMWLLLERELDLHAKEELLVPKDESQDVDQPHEEVHGVEETTQVEPSIRNGRKCTTKVDRLRLDVAQNVGAPTSQRRQRQSPDRFVGYIALMRKCIVTEPSSFQEAMQDPTWVDAMVEEYDSIVKNSAWEIVPRPVDK
jgi:transposase InsO family protein